MHALKATDNDLTRIDALNALAWEAAHTDPEQAVALGQQALEFCRQVYPAGQVDSLAALSFCHAQLGQLDLALAEIQQALALNLKDPARLGPIWYALSRVCYGLGSYDDALEHGLRSLQLNLKGDLVRGRILHLIAQIQAKSQDPTALATLDQSLSAYQRAGARRAKADALKDRCEMLYWRGDLAQALASGRESLECYKRGNYERPKSAVLASLGLVYRALNDRPAAWAYLRRAVAAATDPEAKVTALLALSHLHQDDSDLDPAILQRALALAEESASESLQLRCHERLAELYKRRGDFELALSHFKRFHALQQRDLQTQADLRHRYWRQQRSYIDQQQQELQRQLADLRQFPWGKVLGGSIDTSEPKAVEATLWQQWRFFCSILDTISNHITVRDSNNRIVLLNQAAAALSPCTAEQLIGQAVEIDTGLPLSAQHIAENRQVIEQGSPLVIGEQRKQRSEGWIRTEKFPVQLPNGEKGVLILGTEGKPLEPQIQASNQLLWLIIDTLPALINAKDPQSRYLLMNRHQANLYDTTPEQAIGRSPAELIGPEYGAIAASHDQAVITSGRAITYEETSPDAHGQLHTWLTTKMPLPNPDGQGIQGVINVSVDISDRKRAEEARAQLAAIVESCGDAIISTTPEGQILSWNAGAEATYGYKAAEMLGKNIRLLSGTPQQEDLSMPLSDPCETVHRTRDGRMIDVFLTVSALHNEAQQVKGLAWIARDITERRQLQRMKEEFVSMVSHELRTPLTSIHGSLSVLSTGKLGAFSDKGQRLLAIARDNTARLIRLIRAILDLERLESGKLNLSKQRCDSAELMWAAYETMEVLAQAAGLHLQVRPRSAPLWADPDQLIQVLTNLLSNAIKFSPAQSTISIEARVDGRELLIWVCDQGRGIPAHMLELIFDPFQQVDTSDSRQKGGTGLGLAICRSIIQQHGGQIWAESLLGQGSTFWIRLPLALSPDQIDQLA